VLEALLAGRVPDLTGLPVQVTRSVDNEGRPLTLLSDPPNGMLSTVLRAGLNVPVPAHLTTEPTHHTSPTHSSNLSPAPADPKPHSRTNPTDSPSDPTHPATPAHPKHHSPTNPTDPPTPNRPPTSPSAHLDPTPGWGAIAFRGPPTLLIEVPHPGSDRHTTFLGLALFHAIPTAALLVAGAHRTSADVAHLPESLFHAYAQTLATTELQLHGFAAESAPDTDAVLTPGPGHPTPLHDALTETLTNQGFRVRHHEHLAGRTNAQGMAAAERGAPFLHLELAPLVRLHHRDRVVKAVTDAWHQQGQ
jgi:hypothetical protein